MSSSNDNSSTFALKFFSAYEGEPQWYANNSVRRHFFPNEWLKRVKKYPQWAPTLLLVELLERQDELTETEDSIVVERQLRILEILCTDKNLERFWVNVGKAMSRHEDLGVLYYFIHELYAAIYSDDPWEKMTPKQRSEKLAELIEVERNLAGLLEELQIDTTTFSLLDLESETSAPFPVPLGGIGTLPVEPFAHTHDPLLRTLIIRHARLLESHPPYESTLGAPGLTNLKLTVFVRATVHFLRNNLGRPFHADVGRLAGAFFQRELSSREVEKMCKPSSRR